MRRHETALHHPAHPQEDILFLTRLLPAVGHNHVLGILECAAVEEEDTLGGLLLLQTVQYQLHVETCRPIIGQQVTTATEDVQG